jgi:hypothetical protein
MASAWAAIAVIGLKLVSRPNTHSMAAVLLAQLSAAVFFNSDLLTRGTCYISYFTNYLSL